MRLKSFLDYLKVLLLILFSGYPLILNSSFSKNLFVLLGVFCFVLFLNKPNFKFFREVSLFIIFFIFIFLFQYFIFSWISISGAFGFILKVFIGAYSIRSVGLRFITIYTNIIAFIAFYCSVLYILVNLNVLTIPNLLPIIDFENTNSIGIYIYNFEHNRNQGIFWEPGAFAGYLILGLLFNIENFWKKFNRNKFKFISIIIALISTLSTTAYLLLFIIFFFSSLEIIKKRLIIGFLFSVIIIYLSMRVYNETEFLSEKIQNQYETSSTLDGEYDPSRFGSFLFDLHYIKKHPLIGNGLHDKTRFADHPWLQGDRAGAGNGFSNFIASMGILSLLFIILMIKKNVLFNKKESYFFLFMIIMLLQSEQYFNFPLFLGLPFLIKNKIS